MNIFLCNWIIIMAYVTTYKFKNEKQNIPSALMLAQILENLVANSLNLQNHIFLLK